MLIPPLPLPGTSSTGTVWVVGVVGVLAACGCFLSAPHGTVRVDRLGWAASTKYLCPLLSLHQGQRLVHQIQALARATAWRGRLDRPQHLRPDLTPCRGPILRCCWRWASQPHATTLVWARQLIIRLTVNKLQTKLRKLTVCAAAALLNAFSSPARRCQLPTQYSST